MVVGCVRMRILSWFKGAYSGVKIRIQVKRYVFRCEDAYSASVGKLSIEASRGVCLGAW